MARKSRARLERDADKRKTTITVTAAQTFEELARIRPESSREEIGRWLATMGHDEREATLRLVAERIVRRASGGARVTLKPA